MEFPPPVSCLIVHHDSWLNAAGLQSLDLNFGLWVFLALPVTCGLWLLTQKSSQRNIEDRSRRRPFGPSSLLRHSLRSWLIIQLNSYRAFKLVFLTLFALLVIFFSIALFELCPWFLCLSLFLFLFLPFVVFLAPSSNSLHRLPSP